MIWIFIMGRGVYEQTERRPRIFIYDRYYLQGGISMTTGKNGSGILIVDDEESVGLGMSEMLKDVGFDAAYVINGREALKAVSEKAFRLIFMDIIMPGMNGLETYREIAKISPHTTVILFTGYFRDAENVILKGVQEGMVDEFIRKPYFADEIIRSVQKYCA